MRKIIHTDKAPQFPHRALSQGVETEQFVFTAGMAFDHRTRTRMEAAKTIADETRICLEAIQAILKEAGCDMSDVVKTTCYLSDRAFHNEFDEAYGKFWPNGDYPTRCTFVVGIGGNCRVEIDAVAVKRRR